jgi:hypothetical protein
VPSDGPPPRGRFEAIDEAVLQELAHGVGGVDRPEHPVVEPLSRRATHDDVREGLLDHGVLVVVGRDVLHITSQ